jgi:hypothetical protein
MTKIGKLRANGKFRLSPQAAREAQIKFVQEQL